MVDTVRTVSDILTNLIQDGQPADSISEQDLRDIVVSLKPPHGRCSMQGNATATTISIAGTFYKIAGTTALSGTEHLFDDASGTSNRLRYTGAATKHLHIAVSLSFIAASNNQVCAFKLWKYDDSGASGAYEASSLVTNKIGTGADVQMISLHADCMVDTNDYIEVHVTNETSTANVTVEDMYVFAMGMIE